MIGERSTSRSAECPVCDGTGWELQWEEVEGYGLIQFASKCSKCSSKRIAQDITGVPEENTTAELKNFDWTAYGIDMEQKHEVVTDFFQSFPMWEDEGTSLYIYGKQPGCGKTYLACCLAKSTMMRFDCKMRFVTTVDYLKAVGDSYNGTDDPSEIYRTCRLLVLDDIGVQKSGDWQEAEMFRLINSRIQKGLITIYTSNVMPTELNLDGRTISRISNSVITLQMPEIDIRKRKQVNRESQLRARLKI